MVQIFDIENEYLLFNELTNRTETIDYVHSCINCKEAVHKSTQ